ncbi:MAG: hypothetical protein JSS66_06515 [Armatimonadetes bacterium]|nr:hypothetical protein [Armatimonadota bacterium]
MPDEHDPMPGLEPPVRVPFPLTSGPMSDSLQESVDYLLAEHLIVPEVEEEPNANTRPEDWRAQHLRWMAIPRVAELYEDMETPDQLEASTYWFYCHGTHVYVCPYCLSFCPRLVRISKMNLCYNCDREYLGLEASRAAYLVLLGEKHPFFCGVEDVFRAMVYFFKEDGDVHDMVRQFQYEYERFKEQQPLANAKALVLFKKLFGTKAYNRLLKQSEFWVEGADGLMYRLFYSRHGNIAVYDPAKKVKGRRWQPVRAYCGHFGEEYPVVDQLIAQALMIKRDPKRYTKQANQVPRNQMKLVGPYHNAQDELRKALKHLPTAGSRSNSHLAHL